MPARILLTNLHASHNAGDAALMAAAIRQLEQAFPGARLTLLMNYPASHRGPEQAVGSLFTLVKRAEGGREHWRWAALLGLPWLGLAVWLGRRFPSQVARLLPGAWREVAGAYAAADLVVSCPGGFLFSAGSGLPLVISVFTLALAWLAGKPLYLLPQSIGPLRRAWEHRLVSWQLGRARLVMVRERLSLERAPLPAARERVHLLPDMALTFPGAPQAEGEAWLCGLGLDPARDRPYLGITAIDWQAQNSKFAGQSNYEHALAQAARRFAADCGGTVIFFPQVCGPSHDQDDRIPARRIAGRLADLRERVLVVEEPPAPALLKTAMGLMDLFIGTRMHSNLFALSGGVPFLAIGYQFKTQGIVQMFGLEQWVVDIGQASGEVVAERLMQLWLARDVVRSHLAQRVPLLVSQAEQAGALIAADYRTWRP